MYIDFNRKVGYIAHMRTASRSTSELFIDRGFSRVFGHHTTPFRALDKNGRWELASHKQWFHNEKVQDYTWYATVRNPFDLWLSFQHMYAKQYMVRQGIRGTPELTPKFMMDFMFHYRAAVSNSNYLFPAFIELPECKILRYETLREDVIKLLSDHDLPPLEDHEFQHTEDKKTAGKPQNGYRNHISPEARAYIELKWGHELKRFGYQW